MPSDFKSVISGYTAEASKYSAEGFAAFLTIGFFFAAYGCRASKVHPAVSAGFALTGFIASTIVKDLTTIRIRNYHCHTCFLLVLLAVLPLLF